ncbi:response regulator receiver modulated metal dependent phosphohydrolase [Gloeothece citriformis PCC 7424]|uniref:Response regulator receiver modulated metal dependent phosphohydrolase n=1 Tax=Gloeothece citriformis (strain PCC 7424) TaxID=65393 RepID=B7KIE1_GLOC7|nr:HD domain-containing phosphohydrolase [Gloeothece citriformis]ACK73628.1 response regulator receiver modulated metal dependent phosphohydrolase [Gloeothece citriformis PCC 7424]
MKVSHILLKTVSGNPINISAMNAIVNCEPAKILIIDEHPHSRMAVKDLLCLDGYEVIETDENLNITDHVLKKRPDLILLDVMMPQMEGFKVCQQLKQDERTSGIPIIFMTVAEDHQLRRRCTQAGGDDVLTKPIERLKLSSRVKSLIEQKRLYEGLDQIEQVLFAIARAIENRYPNNGNSCARLATLANSFGKYLQLPFSSLQNLRYAAYLHDIGMVSIPDEIMLKKGELTPEERGIIQQHVLIGEEICQPLPNRRGVLPIIRHHHERWDGTGYPDGLVGNEIPWLAQIFQILDIYVALISERPHKKIYHPQEAIEIITEEGAKGWRNPELVKQFTNFIITRELLIHN